MRPHAIGALLVLLGAACGGREAPTEEPRGSEPPTGRAEATPSPRVARPASGARAAPVVGPPGTLTEVDAASLPATLRARPAPYLLVNVWSTWCEPCVEEMPELLRTARAYEPRGLEVVLISADPPSRRAAAVAFLREQGAPWPSFLKRGSDDAFITALHPEWTGALPATLLLDRERRVRHFWPDPVSASELRGPLEHLLGAAAEPSPGVDG
ncbi:MAG: TlpA disulfide reductase family protein [Sandaracinaceae bacterium]